MNKRYVLLLAAFLGITLMQAQTLSQARELFNQGKYAEALPAFQRLVKQSPSNANYNYWYGACCVETGADSLATPYLEKAAKRKVLDAYLYLTRAQMAQYLYDEAVETCEDYIELLTAKKKETTDAETALARARMASLMLRGTERVCVIDSFVVDKQQLLEAYRLSPESGTLAYGKDYFQEDGREGILYENELGNRLYYSKLQKDSTLHIFTSNKIMNELSQGKALPDNINEAGANSNYPYMLSDGVTLYYASDGARSLGGYDIFVTRYNTNTDTYLTPENVGMPFNSPYNDYLYVIDEFNNLGWFASDRYQPEGKVCIYVFVPNTSKRVYNYEGMEQDRLISLARLDSIAATWGGDLGQVEAAKTRLQAALRSTPTVGKPAYDFDFIIDDRHVYHSLDDFRSADAKVRYRQYAQGNKNLEEQLRKLDALRLQYQQADKNGKNNLAAAILDLEQLTLRLMAEQKQAAIEIRKLEKQVQP